MSSNQINLFGQNIIIFFLLILIIGLIYEWLKGGLEWE
jgi:NADH:ubiquinone oxidoreductase subunit 3 (subunit A)